MPTWIVSKHYSKDQSFDLCNDLWLKVLSIYACWKAISLGTKCIKGALIKIYKMKRIKKNAKTNDAQY